MDRHDVRVLQVRRSFRFRAKAPHVLRARQNCPANHLQGDRAVETDLPRLIDDAHSSERDFSEQFVIAEVLNLRPRFESGAEKALRTEAGRRVARKFSAAF